MRRRRAPGPPDQFTPAASATVRPSGLSDSEVTHEECAASARGSAGGAVSNTRMTASSRAVASHRESGLYATL